MVNLKRVLPTNSQHHPVKGFGLGSLAQKQKGSLTDPYNCCTIYLHNSLKETTMNDSISYSQLRQTLKDCLDKVCE